jgi:hypothetical protein
MLCAGSAGWDFILMFDYRLPPVRACAADFENQVTAQRAAEFEGAGTPVVGGQANG